jgi:hypothetical protein
MTIVDSSCQAFLGKISVEDSIRSLEANVLGRLLRTNTLAKNIRSKSLK